MGWLALDDTDTLDGGCTTYSFDKILRDLNQMSSMGFPWNNSKDERLVRLWPFATRRTRGNASVSAQIEVEQEGHQLFFETLTHLFEKHIDEPTDEIPHSKHSNREQYPPAPVMLWFENKPSEKYYWNAVRSEVKLESIRKSITENPDIKFWKNGDFDGAIGAQAAAAWSGENDCTWELTSYRNPHMRGKKRSVPMHIVEQMDDQFPNTILNRDPNQKKSLIAPRSNCPVLYGIRSRDSISAESAHLWMQTHADMETAANYRIWRTNQATDDHLEGKWRGRVLSNPEEYRKGHASVMVKGRHILNKHNSYITNNYLENEHEMTLLAFSQGGPVNSVLRSTNQGDVIEWMGLISPDGSHHVEKLRIIVPVQRNKIRPKCSCGTRMKSMGKNQGLRCPKCKNITGDMWEGDRYVPHKESKQGWVQPRIDSRRHLAAPLE